ncbi:MAG: hypothetical protein ACLVAV_02470 [Clostridium sp.]
MKKAVDKMKEKISLLKRVSIVDDARSILRDMVIPPELLKRRQMVEG